VDSIVGLMAELLLDAMETDAASVKEGSAVEVTASAWGSEGWLFATAAVVTAGEVVAGVCEPNRLAKKSDKAKNNDFIRA
jgi:hypothetical protein